MDLNLELFADYFQFYLQDDSPGVELRGEAWTQDATDRTRIASTPSVVMVGTATNASVDVELSLLAQEPASFGPEWHHVVEADLACASGRIVIAGCTDYFPDAKRVPVTPGNYRVRVLYGDRLNATVEGEDSGDTLRYRVELWPTNEKRSVAVLKQGPIPWSG